LQSSAKLKMSRVPFSWSDTTYTFSRSKNPEAAGHVEAAQAKGSAVVLTIDRTGTKGRRRDSLRGIATAAGKDRDEYPPAMFKEGGLGASVTLIDSSDNRSAGAAMGAALRQYPNDTTVEI